MFSTSGFSIKIERLLSTCSPTCVLIYPDVLNIPRCIHDIPRCTHGIPPMYSLYLMHHDIPQCTHDIPQRPHGIPDILNTPPPRCTEHTLYRVIGAQKKVLRFRKGAVYIVTNPSRPTTMPAHFIFSDDLTRLFISFPN